MFFWHRSSNLLCIRIDDTHVHVALVKSQDADGKDTVKQVEHEPITDGAVKMNVIENPDEVAKSLRRALERIKGNTKKYNVCFGVPANLFYSAFVDNLPRQPKGRSGIVQIAEEWLPFPYEELLVRNEWHNTTPLFRAHLSLSAVENKTLQHYKTLASRAELSAPKVLPCSYGAVALAFGSKGAQTPSVVLDVSSNYPVMTLVLGHTIMDERVLFSKDLSATFCETLQSWVHIIHAEPRDMKKEIVEQRMQSKEEEKTMSKSEKRKLEKERAKAEKAALKEEEKRRKEEEKKRKEMEKKQKEQETVAKKEAAPTTATATEKPSATAEKKKEVIAVKIIGPQEKVFDLQCPKFTDVSVLTQNVPAEPADHIFALALSAAYTSKNSLPSFS